MGTYELLWQAATDNKLVFAAAQQTHLGAQATPAAAYSCQLSQRSGAAHYYQGASARGAQAKMRVLDSIVAASGV